MDSKRKYTENKSIVRATKIIYSLRNGMNSLSEISRYCKYSPPTVHRILQQMVDLDWANQDAISHKYFLGSLFTEIASDFLAAHRYLVVNAYDEMNSLSIISEETVNLAVLVQLHYVQLHNIISRHSLAVSEVSHNFMPPFTGATGKVLLSQLDDREIEDILSKVNIASLTNNKISESRLLAQLKEIQRHGFAVSTGERVPGSSCISVPVRNYTYPAALSIQGPAERLQPKTKYLTEMLKKSAELISGNISGMFTKRG